MAKRTRSPAEKYHDRVAGIYDTIYERNPYWEIVFGITWRNIKRHLPADTNARCLDIGCGTGRWGLRLLKSGYPTDFLDISQKMLDQVAIKLAKRRRAMVAHDSLVEHVREPAPPLAPDTAVLWHATVDDFSALPSESYDFIVGQGDPLGCAARPERALKELTRLLKPGGVMLMSVDNRWQGIYPYFKESDLAGLVSFLKNGRTRWITDEPDEQYPIATFTPEGIRALCRRRGLELVGLIGKTVLPLRRFRKLLDDPAWRETLSKLEEHLHAEEALLANAAHLEFAARKPRKTE